jgi:hypothetical protein
MKITPSTRTAKTSYAVKRSCKPGASSRLPTQQPVRAKCTYLLKLTTPPLRGARRGLISGGDGIPMKEPSTDLLFPPFDPLSRERYGPLYLSMKEIRLGRLAQPKG